MGAKGMNPRSGEEAIVIVIVREPKGGYKALLRFEDGYRMAVPGSCINPV